MCRKVISEETKRSREIDEELEKEKRETMRKIRLLLLGTGESGKSTFCKQMKILHLNGFPESERKLMRSQVYTNIFSNVDALLESLRHFNVALSTDNRRIPKYLQNMTTDRDAFEQKIQQIGRDIKSFYNDAAIQMAISRKAEFQLSDSAEYFFQNIDRIFSPDYIPTVEDILRIRVRSTGIVELDFRIEKIKCSVIDVGGQRSERKKWIRAFSDVTAIFFFAAISEYDQRLFEDNYTNRLSESIKLFQDICTYKLFSESQVSIILFLNKMDIFREKIERVPFSTYFCDYKGSNEVEEASDYMKNKYLEVVPPHKKVYCHKVIATDTGSVSLAFKDVRDTLIRNLLSNTGFSGLIM